jgi:hypothetical protein
MDDKQGTGPDFATIRRSLLPERLATLARGGRVAAKA